MIPPHLYGLPPAVVRMRARREREEGRIAVAGYRRTLGELMALARGDDGVRLTGQDQEQARMN